MRSGRLAALMLLAALVLAAGLDAVCRRWELETRLEVEVHPASCRSTVEFARNVLELGHRRVRDEEDRRRFLRRQTGVVAEATVRAEWTRDAVRLRSAHREWVPTEAERWAEDGRQLRVLFPEIDDCAVLERARRWVGILDRPCCDTSNDDLLCEMPPLRGVRLIEVEAAVGGSEAPMSRGRP